MTQIIKKIKHHQHNSFITMSMTTQLNGVKKQHDYKIEKYMYVISIFIRFTLVSSEVWAFLEDEELR